MKHSKLLSLTFLAALLAGFGCGCAFAAERSADVAPYDIYLEGTYFGAQRVNFTLAVTKNEYVKTFDNGIQIAGERKRGNITYYIIDTKKRLITKISQASLYRLGAFINWNAATGLVNLGPGATLVKEHHGDSVLSCEWYSVEKERIRICMNAEYNMPVAIEEDGKTVERTFRLERLPSNINAEALVAQYVKQNYRLVDADGDISPDAD